MRKLPATVTIPAPAPRAATSFLRRSLLAVACVAGLSGCATLVTDDHQTILITSDPLGATCQVQEGGAIVGTILRTPGTLLVGKSRHDIAINCAKAGYYPGAAVLEPHFQDMTVGNIVVGGLTGLLVDTSTGAINEYPHWVSVLMKRQPLPGESRAETERLSDIESARQQAMRENLVRR